MYPMHLHGTLDEEVFMDQPQGFVDPNFPSHVCKLYKALYGLKQAHRAWFTRLSNSLQCLKFSGSLVDSSLFVFSSNGLLIYLLVYVDDIFIIGNNLHAISSLICALQCEFPLKDLGNLSYFLGIEAICNVTGVHLC